MMRQAYSLSRSQKRFWFQEQLSSNKGIFNQPVAIRCQEEIQFQILTDALNKMAVRHFSLRTVFDIEDKEPKQFVLEKLEYTILCVDAEGNSKEEKEHFIEQAIKKDLSSPFDLSKGPLMRVSAYRIEEKNYILFFNMHHIITDGWSTEIFLQELFIIYQCLLAGTPIPLEKQEIQYVDFAHWQNRFLNSPKMKKQEEYWKEKLSGKISKLELPIDYERREHRDDAVHYLQYLTICADDVERLEQINKEYKTTMFMTISSALTVLLHKLTNQNDILIGTPISGRTNKQVQNTIGLFINTVILRNTVDPEQSFGELLSKVKQDCLSTYANQDFQFEQMIGLCDVDRKSNRGELFDVLINYAGEHTKNYSFQNQNIRKMTYPFFTEKNEFDLTFTIENKDKEIGIAIHYASDLFKEETIKRFCENFQNIIHYVSLHPERAVKDIEYLSKEEWNVIQKVNDTSKDNDTSLLIPHLFQKQVIANRDAIAVIDNGVTVTYGMLSEKAAYVKNLIYSNKTKDNGLVAIMMERSWKLIACLMGILQSGCAYVPIEPDYPEDRISYMLKDSNADLLLTEKKYADKGKSFTSAKTIILEEIEFEGELQKDNINQVQEVMVKPEDLAYVIYTSGSTGEPKGVMISHGAILNTLLWLQDTYPLTDKDMVAQKTSASFTDSVWEFFWPLIVGSKMTIIPTADVKQPAKLYKRFKEDKVTITQFVPALMNMFIHEVEHYEEKEHLPDLKLVFNGGEALPAHLVRSWYQLFINAKIADIYGMTESAIYATNHFIEECPDESETSISLGVPIANVKAYILDQAGQLAGFRIKGEICIGGIGLMDGYLGKDDLTQKAFIKHPITGEKLYRTGDLGYQNPDGSFEYSGRRDSQLQIRGFRVETGEIEYQLRTHEDINEVAVVPFELGEQTRLSAFYVAKEKLDRKELRQFLGEKLPYYMIPSRFIWLESMPLNVNGKIDRRKLPAVEECEEIEEEYIAPTHDVEQGIHDIWCEILGLTRISTSDDFFDAGGDSWTIIQVIVEVEKKFGITLELEKCYHNPSIAYMAELVQEAMKHKEMK